MKPANKSALIALAMLSPGAGCIDESAYDIPQCNPTMVSVEDQETLADVTVEVTNLALQALRGFENVVDDSYSFRAAKIAVAGRYKKKDLGVMTGAIDGFNFVSCQETEKELACSGGEIVSEGGVAIQLKSLTNISATKDYNKTSGFVEVTTIEPDSEYSSFIETDGDGVCECESNAYVFKSISACDSEAKVCNGTRDAIRWKLLELVKRFRP